MELRLIGTILLFGAMICSAAARRQRRPNIIVLFADDLGYGDLQVYGHPTSSTPNLNRLAAGGKVFTQFYAAAAICSPSRAALLTGRYHMRSGIYPGVFNVTSSGGLPHREITIAEMLKQRGYYTSMVGKWHLGVGRGGEYLPPSQGFDEFLGLPASHSHCPCSICFAPNQTCLFSCKQNYSPCPLYNGTTIIEQPIDLLTLDEKYAAQARRAIRRSVEAGRRFFLYYSFQHTHDPPYADFRHTGSTARGDYGDALAAMDWEIGQVMEELELNGIMDQTFIFFTADNGPSLSKPWGGSVGLLKCGKATTYEGGVRVPAIAHWPGRIKPGYTLELSSTLDLLPTIANIAGARLPPVTLDGVDMAPFLFRGEKSSRETFFYYSPAASERHSSFAVRYRQYKAHFYTKGSTLSGKGHPDPDCRKTAKRTKHDPPLLFDLHRDPAEQYNIAHEPEFQEVISLITRIREDFDSRMEWGESELKKPSFEEYMPCCNPGCRPRPYCCHCTTTGTVAYNPWELYTDIWQERDHRFGTGGRRDRITPRKERPRDKSDYYNTGRDGSRRVKGSFFNDPVVNRDPQRDIFDGDVVERGRVNRRDRPRDSGRDRDRANDGNRGQVQDVFDDSLLPTGREMSRERPNKERGNGRENGRNGSNNGFQANGRGDDRGSGGDRSSGNGRGAAEENTMNFLAQSPSGEQMQTVHIGSHYIDLTLLDNTRQESADDFVQEGIKEETEDDPVNPFLDFTEDQERDTSPADQTESVWLVGTTTPYAPEANIRKYFDDFSAWQSDVDNSLESSYDDATTDATAESDLSGDNSRREKNISKRIQRQQKKEQRQLKKQVRQTKKQERQTRKERRRVRFGVDLDRPGPGFL
ncbi:arylsulfatase A-like [Diadema antillarum]|uniref:arylsulfatase A-like n=1 Tax=Diadema antillarum TaxID=105358 RepID=UPI003A8A63FF